MQRHPALSACRESGAGRGRGAWSDPAEPRGIRAAQQCPRGRGGAAGSFLPLGTGGRRGRSRGQRGGEATRRAGGRPQGPRGSVRSIPRPGTAGPGRRRSARPRPHPGPPPTAREGRPRRAGARPAGEISPARSGQCIFPPARCQGRGVGSCGLGSCGLGGALGEPGTAPTYTHGPGLGPGRAPVSQRSDPPLLRPGSFLLGNHKSEPSEWPHWWAVNWVPQMALKSLKREQFRQSASSFRFFFPRSQSWLNLKNDTLILKCYSCLFFFF